MPPNPHASGWDFTDSAFLDRLRTELRRMGVGRKLPPVRKWNKRKPPDLPSIQHIVKAMPGISTYADLALWAGLEPVRQPPQPGEYAERMFDEHMAVEVERLANNAAGGMQQYAAGLPCIERHSEIHEYERDGQVWRLTRTWYTVR